MERENEFSIGHLAKMTFGTKVFMFEILTCPSYWVTLNDYCLQRFVGRSLQTRSKFWLVGNYFCNIFENFCKIILKYYHVYQVVISASWKKEIELAKIRCLQACYNRHSNMDQNPYWWSNLSKIMFYMTHHLWITTFALSNWPQCHDSSNKKVWIFNLSWFSYHFLWGCLPD